MSSHVGPLKAEYTEYMYTVFRKGLLILLAAFVSVTDQLSNFETTCKGFFASHKVACN